jgi:hypothetical protein
MRKARKQHRSQHRHGQQAGYSRHRIVDARCDAGASAAGRSHHQAGQWRDGHRHADGENANGWKNAGPVRGAKVCYGQQRQPARCNNRTQAQRDSRPKTVRDTARKIRSEPEDQRQRQQRRAGLRGGVQTEPDQAKREKIQGSAERKIQQQRQTIGAGKVARPEQRQRHHRPIRVARLDRDETSERGHSQTRDTQHRDIAEAEFHDGPQRPGDAGQTHDDQDRAFPVDRLRFRVPAFTGEKNRKRARHHGQGNVEPEDGAPGHLIDQPAAEHRTCRCGQRAEAGPKSDRPAAFIVGKRRPQHRQACRRQQRRAKTLHRPARNQDGYVRRQAASHRRRREDGNADQKNPAAAVDVGGRSAHQHKCPEQQQIGIDDPRRRRGIGAERALDRRHSHIHHGAVDEGHARSENGGGKRQLFLPR